jgi:hypothetical protein
MKKYGNNDKEYNSKRLKYLLKYEGQKHRSFSEKRDSINETIKDNTMNFVKKLIDDEINKLYKHI